MPWDTHDAEQLAAAFIEAEKIGPCPACGAVPIIEMIDISDFGGQVQYLPGLAHCSADCWEEDPQRYLDAVAAAKTVEHDQTG